MKTNNIIRSYVIRGFLIGLFFPILGILMSCCAFSPSGNEVSLIVLHKSFPLLWVIDSAPIVLGLISFIVGSQVQKGNLKLNSQVKSTNEVLLLKNEELEKFLLEKEVLLKEVHHRVKNNLQVVNGLLSLQASFLDDKKLQAIFQYSQQRITSMAMIHEMLYHSDDLSKIDINEYITKLIDELISAFKLPTKIIKLELDASCWFSIDTAIPLGILINEIVTNSLKHGFEKKEEGKIKIQIQKLEAPNYTMTISDNGVGFNGGLDGEQSKTLGLLLISQLAIQVNGTITKDKTETGTQYSLNFQEIANKR